MTQSRGKLVIGSSTSSNSYKIALNMQASDMGCGYMSGVGDNPGLQTKEITFFHKPVRRPNLEEGYSGNYGVGQLAELQSILFHAAGDEVSGQKTYHWDFCFVDTSRNFTTDVTDVTYESDAFTSENISNKNVNMETLAIMDKILSTFKFTQ